MIEASSAHDQVKRMSHATFETPDLDRQIDYFTQTADRRCEQENAAPSSQPSSVSRCSSRRVSTPDARDWRSRSRRRPIRRHPARDRGRGRALSDAQRSNTRHPRMLAFEPQRERSVVFATQAPDRQEPAGDRHRADKLGHLAFVVPEPKNMPRSTPACSLSVSTDQDWFVFMRCGRIITP